MATLRVLIAYRTTIGGSPRQTNLDRRAYEARVLPLYEGAIYRFNENLYSRPFYRKLRDWTIQSDSDRHHASCSRTPLQSGWTDITKRKSQPLRATSRIAVLKDFALKLTHYLLDVTVILLFILVINSEILASARTLLPV